MPAIKLLEEGDSVPNRLTRPPRRSGASAARRALAGALLWAMTLGGWGAGSATAQPFNPSPQQPQTPTPPGGGQPFVPQPGAPQQTLPQQKVAEVTVRGNEHVPTDQILAVVSTRPNDPLNEDKLRNDVQSILGLGLFADAVVRIEPLPEGVRVVFVVVENPIITQVVITGNTVVPTDDIVKALNVPTGQVLSTVAMRNGARAVEKVYQDRGYVLARVADVSVSQDGVLTVTMAEGRVEAIKIEGLQKTKDYVVRRELLFKPGDVFNANTVNQSLRRLFGLQYFSDVKAQPGPGTQPDTVDVTIQVTEQKTAAVTLGVGYSTVTGIEGLIGARDSDFGGNGQTVFATYNSTALNGNNFAVNFREPYFLGTRTGMEVQGFNQTTIPADYSLGLGSPFNYNMSQTGGQVLFTSPLSPIHSLSYGAKSVNTTFDQPTFGTAPPAGFPFPPFTPGTVNAILLGAAEDTRNDPTNPTEGDRIALTTESAIPSFGSAFSFEKYELDYTKYYPTGGNAAIVGHVHLGAASTSLPVQEQYYLGGQSSLRGYANGRFRGDQMVLITGEYRFPLSNIGFFKSFQGVTAILFVDAGDVEPFGSGVTFTLKSDYGVGISVKTGLGLFRLDYGFSAEGTQLWISTGTFF